MKNLFILSTALISSGVLLSGCLSGVGMGVAQAGASHAIKGSLYKNSARNMTCEEIEADIAERKRGMINPLAIPDIRVQIASVKEVAEEKGCPGYGANAVLTDSTAENE